MPNEVGRPTVFTPETLDKLKEGFLRGYSDEEACLYAEISPAALYKYQIANPEYVEQKEQWKKTPLTKAKNVINEAIEKKDREISKWYLERKNKKEFGNNLDVTTDGKPLPILGSISNVPINNSDKKDSKTE